MTMDSLYGSDRKLGDLDDSGVGEFLLDQDIFPASSNMVGQFVLMLCLILL